MDAKFEGLKEILRETRGALVAFSGGVDSTFLVKVAHVALGDRAIAMTTASPTAPPGELEAAEQLAKLIGCRHITVPSHELDNPSFSQNPVNRCYFCKDELYRICRAQADQLGLETVVDGTNLDDLKDHRPGLKAAKEWRIRHPLVEARFTKEEIRHYFGLPDEKLPVIHNGVDTEDFHPRLRQHRSAVRGKFNIPENARLFLFVGSGFERKGVAVLLDVMAQMPPHVFLLIVGRDITLSGEISACDRLVVEGQVEASLPSARIIEVAPTGFFKGSADVEEADISGRYEGELIARDRLIVRAGGRIRGTIRYGRIVIESGGQISGDMQTLEGTEPAKNPKSDIEPGGDPENPSSTRGGKSLTAKK